MAMNVRGLQQRLTSLSLERLRDDRSYRPPTDGDEAFQIGHAVTSLEYLHNIELRKPPLVSAGLILFLKNQSTPLATLWTADELTKQPDGTGSIHWSLMPDLREELPYDYRHSPAWPTRVFRAAGKTALIEVQLTKITEYGSRMNPPFEDGVDAIREWTRDVDDIVFVAGKHLISGGEDRLVEY